MSTDKLLTDGGNAGTPAVRGIVNEEGIEDRIPLLGWRRSDAIFVGLVGIFTFFLVGVRAGVLGIPLTAIGIGIGVVVIYAKPSGMNIIDASKIAFDYLMQPDIIFAASKEADSDMRNKGGIQNRTPFKPTTRTQDLTNIKLAFPNDNAVLTKDGRMERMIEITGENMDFADAGVWGSRQSVGQELANRVVEDRVKLHITTRDFDFDAVMERLEHRMEHNDIKQAPIARAILEEYYSRRPKEMEQRGSQEVRVFLLLSVARKDVSTGYTEEPTPLEKVANLPIVGPLAEKTIGSDADTNKQEKTAVIHDKMIAELDQMCRKAEDAFIMETRGYNYRRLTTVEMVTLAAELFNSREVQKKHIESVITEDAPAESDGGKNPAGKSQTRRRAGVSN